MNRHIIMKTTSFNDTDGTKIDPVETRLENVFGASLTEDKLLGISRNKYLLKISVDMSKYRNTEDYKLPKMTDFINELLSEVFEPKKNSINIAVICRDLVTYEEVLYEQTELNREIKNNHLCAPSISLVNGGKKIGTTYFYTPASPCEIEIRFEHTDDKGEPFFKITFISYTSIVDKEIDCRGGRGYSDFPVYKKIENKLEITVPTNVTKDRLKQKITTPSISDFRVSAVEKISETQFFYGWDEKTIDDKTVPVVNEYEKKLKENKEQNDLQSALRENSSDNTPID